MDYELRNRLKAELLRKLYISFYEGVNTHDKKELVESVDAAPSDVENVIGFLWDRDSIKVDYGTGVIEIKLKGILVVEHEVLANRELIESNIDIREKLMLSFYEMSDDNGYDPVDSAALAESIGIDAEALPVHFHVIEMMEHGNMLADGSVLMRTDGKKYCEETYE